MYILHTELQQLALPGLKHQVLTQKQSEELPRDTMSSLISVHLQAKDETRIMGKKFPTKQMPNFQKVINYCSKANQHEIVRSHVSILKF